MGGPFRHKIPYVIIGILLLGALATSTWVVWGDLAGKGGEGGEKPKDTTVVPSFTLEQLGRATWHISDLTASKGGAIYTAKVVDGQNRGVFDLKVDGTTGEPAPRGTEDTIGANPAPSSLLDIETLRARTSDVLTRLAEGQAKAKEGGAVLEVALTYQSKQVATINVDPGTKTIIAKGQNAPPGSKGQEKPEGKNTHLVSGKLVQPLGWLAAMVAIVSTLYYSWRRAQTSVIRESSGDAKAVGIRRLGSLLRWHEAFGFLALGLAVLHLVNFWGKLQVNTSWLLLFMMVSIVLSGLVREFTGRYQVVRTYWRSFHIPYTILFFAVLVVHVLMKTEVLGKD